MNTYYLNDTPLAAFGFVPGHASGSNIALSGAWDMPARTGDSYRQWDGEDGVEPYVSADDGFAFGSREIELAGHLVADDEASLRENIERFRRFLAALPATSQLRCDWGQWSVGLRKEVKITPRRNIASVTLAFTEPAPAMPGYDGQPAEWPEQWLLATRCWNETGVWTDRGLWYDMFEPGAWILDTGLWNRESGVWDRSGSWFGNKKYDLDDWRWESFGLVIASTEGAWDLPARREIKANQFPVPDRWAPGGLDKHTLSLTATLRAPDMENFGRRVRALCWVFGQPGLRSLSYKGRQWSLFAPEGFQVTDIQKRSQVYAKFTVKLIEAHE
ncbi:MAG: hypothetical protein LIO68_00095 [Rikenellaceae bacterium]|nr:hypothetical protein [Rikenellaceae bacterium]